MIYFAYCLKDDDKYSVKKDQIIASMELNNELFINPETENFDQEMFNSYFPVVVSSSPRGALAEFIGCVWKKQKENDNIVVVYPIIVSDDII